MRFWLVISVAQRAVARDVVPNVVSDPSRADPHVIGYIACRVSHIRPVLGTNIQSTAVP